MKVSRNYSCSCQGTMTFASYTGHTRLMSKTHSPIKLPCFLDFQRDIQRNTKRPECFTAWGSASVSQELKNLWSMPLKAARPGLLHASLQNILSVFSAYLAKMSVFLICLLFVCLYIFLGMVSPLCLCWNSLCRPGCLWTQQFCLPLPPKCWD